MWPTDTDPSDPLVASPSLSLPILDPSLDLQTSTRGSTSITSLQRSPRRSSRRRPSSEWDGQGRKRGSARTGRGEREVRLEGASCCVRSFFLSFLTRHAFILANTHPTQFPYPALGLSSLGRGDLERVREARPRAVAPQSPASTSS